MVRTILTAKGEVIRKEVGNGFETWNRAIGADTGTIVETYDGSMEIWCDENILLSNAPQINRMASLLTGSAIYGDVIVFRKGDIK